MANLITGLFDAESAAENAVSELHAIGYGPNEVSIIMRDRATASEFAASTGSRTMESVGAGAAIGGTLGAVLAGILAVGSIAIPGAGLLATGALAAMFAGAGAGGLAGSLIGWLVGAGIPEEVAPYYEQGLNEGGIVVAVAAHPGDEVRVQQILHGGAVAYAGINTLSYIAPEYATRINSMNQDKTNTADQGTLSQNNVNPANATPDPNLTSRPNYDSDQTNAYLTGMNTNEAAENSLNSTGAEQREVNSDASAHEAEARDDGSRTNSLNGKLANAENEVDRTNASLHNTIGRTTTGV